MNSQLFAVRQRRDELLARIASQREQIAGVGARWQTPLAFADQALVAVRFLRSNLVLVAGVAAMLAIRRRGVVGFMKAAWRGWKIYRLAKSFASTALDRF